MRFTFRDKNGNIPKIENKEVWFEIGTKDYFKTKGIDFLFISNGYEMILESESSKGNLIVLNEENWASLCSSSLMTQ